MKNNELPPPPKEITIQSDILWEKETKDFPNNYQFTNICIWPDGTWCRKENLHEYTWKSDDYKEYQMETGISDEEIENQLNYNFED